MRDRQQLEYECTGKIEGKRARERERERDKERGE
jgi:hypothetical protein